MSIFPTATAGGLPVRDASGQPQEQLSVENAYVPAATFGVTCALNYLPSTCDARLEPRQINSIVSELLCLAASLNPNGTWNCQSLCNLSDSLQEWVSSNKLTAAQIAAAIAADPAQAIAIAGLLISPSESNLVSISGGIYVGIDQVIASICQTTGARDGLVGCLVSAVDSNILTDTLDEGLYLSANDITKAICADDVARAGLAECLAASSGSVLYLEQTLTDEQKAQARQNIGVSETPGVGPAVLYTEQILTPTQQAQARQNIGILASIVPGMILWWPTTTAPDGFIECNGAAISRTAFNNLFAIIGTSFGAGDGSTTFNIPDLRGEFIRGYDDGRGIDSGRVFGSLQGYTISDHNHALNKSSFAHYHDYAAMTGVAPVTTNVVLGGSAALTGYFPSNTNQQTTDWRLQDGGLAYTELVTGTTAGTETRPRNVALLPVIKW